MTKVNPNETLILHRRALGWKYALIAMLMVALGGSIFWIGPEEGEVGLVVAAIICILMGFGCLAAVVTTHRRAGEPMISLSPEGITFELQGAGPVAWTEFTGLRSFAVRGQNSLIVQITDDAHRRIVQSKAMRAMAKADDVAFGAKGLSIWQNQIETPLDDLAGLIALYSAAHGGPDLRVAA